MSNAHARVIERLKTSGDEVRRLCRDLDEVTISKRTDPDKWSVKEILAHVARLQEVFEQRLDAILAKEGAPITSYDPSGDPDFAEISKRSADELWKWFLKVRGSGMPNGNRVLERKNGSVVMYDSANVEIARYNFFNAWPSKISTDALSADGNDPLKETITLTCERFERVK